MVGNKFSDIVAGRLAEARATRELKQRVCLFLVLVGGERSRLRPGWRRELSAHSERRSHLRDWLSACGVLRSGLNRLSAHCELRSDLRELSVHNERRSDLQRLSAHCELRSDLRRLSAQNERRSDLERLSAHCELRSYLRRLSAHTERRSGLKCRLHGSSLGQKRRGCVRRRCGARLQRSRDHQYTRHARFAL